MPEFPTIDASVNGPIYGDYDGISRIAELEQQIHALHVRDDHPRILLNNDNIQIYRSRVQSNHPAWAAVLNNSNNSDAIISMINSAFVYQILKDSDPVVAN